MITTQTKKTKTTKKQASKSVAPVVSQVSDEELFRSFQASADERIFAKLIGRYEKDLYRYLCRFLGNAAMAEDVFQATFLQVFLKSAQFDTKRRFRPWLYTVATNQAIDMQRRNKRHNLTSLDQRNQYAGKELGVLGDLIASGQQPVLELLEQEDRNSWVRNNVASLPETLQLAVQLVYFKGMKYREAADILSVPVGTVKSRLHSAIVKLREAWILSSYAAA